MVSHLDLAGRRPGDRCLRVPPRQRRPSGADQPRPWRQPLLPRPRCPSGRVGRPARRVRSEVRDLVGERQPGVRRPPRCGTFLARLPHRQPVGVRGPLSPATGSSRQGDVVRGSAPCGAAVSRALGGTVRRARGGGRQRRPVSLWATAYFAAAGVVSRRASCACPSGREPIYLGLHLSARPTAHPIEEVGDGSVSDRNIRMREQRAETR